MLIVPKPRMFPLLRFRDPLELIAGSDGRLLTFAFGLAGGLPERLPDEVLLNGVLSPMAPLGLI